jgi:ABC-type phosphate transport system substrate-binding protein
MIPATIFLLLSALGAPDAGAVKGRSGADELAVVVNPDIDFKRVDEAMLEAIFTAARRTWPNGEAIRAFNYEPESKLRVIFDQVVLRMSPFEVGRFWVDQRVRGQVRPPREIADPELIRRLVASLPGSIAYLPASAVDSSVRVVARIRGNRLVGP